MTDLSNQRNQRKRLPSYVALTVNNFCKCNAIIGKYSTPRSNIFKSISRSQYLASHLDLATRLRSSARETILAILDARPSPSPPVPLCFLFFLCCPGPETFTHIGHSRDPPDDIRQRGVAMFPVSTSVISIVTRTSWSEGSRSAQEFGRSTREASPTSGERRHPGTALRYR